MSIRRKPGTRRAEIRKNRPAAESSVVARVMAEDNQMSVVIVVLFAIAAAVILMLRPLAVPYRPGQWIAHDIVSRIDFRYRDASALETARTTARNSEPRIYRPTGDQWGRLQDALLILPDKIAKQKLEQLPDDLRSIFDNATLAKLQEIQSKQTRAAWKEDVEAYVRSLRSLGLIVLPSEDRRLDIGKFIRIPGVDAVRTETTLDMAQEDDLIAKFEKPASDNFGALLYPKIVKLTLKTVGPTHEVDPNATAAAQNRAADVVAAEAATVDVRANQTIAHKGEITPATWLELREENRAFLEQLGPAVWQQRFGLAGLVVILSGVMAFYVAEFQPRVVKNHARAVGIASLLLSMLLLAQLSRLGPNNIYFFGVAPTIVVAVILAIAYDQRFALGLAGLHAVLATLALNEGFEFLLVLLAGTATCCFMLDDVRTRSRLIEVGGATAVVMMAAVIGVGSMSLDPFRYTLLNALYTGAAGLGVGFLILGILPFIERTFRITTSMTLLELADASHPLLRRLAIEAPGTYNHSLQVAALAEEAAEAIGANSLLARVAAYYHDAGKINKADYFVENQGQGHNRHLNLSPSVSLLIIIGHVKDGVELAKEYNLPTSIFPFIQQHHGTTLVEFFYHRALTLKDQRGETADVEEAQYRYPGPKPRTKEVAIVMLSDACESACRAMNDPAASRIETLVHDLAMRRLTDGQFDDCDLTMRELEMIERALVKALLGIYHGRLAYPTDTRAEAAVRDQAKLA